MKALNNLKFIANLTIKVEEYKDRILNAENLEKARAAACALNGFLECATTYLNTMIDTENNDFTDELDALIDEWRASMFGAMADKAIELKADPAYIGRLINRRDEIAQ